MPAWTPNTLAAQILGELNQDRNADGGTIPTRLLNCVMEAYEQLWETRDWTFRYDSDDSLPDAGGAISTVDEAPDLDVDEAPDWPKKMNRGWRLLALSNAATAFGQVSVAKQAADDYGVWLALAAAEDDRAFILSDLASNGASLATVHGLARQIAIELKRNEKAEEARQTDRRVLLAAISNIVLECGKALWTYQDWRWRRKQATLTIEAGDTEADLPEDFGEFDGRWLRKADSCWPLRIYEDASQWQAIVDSGAAALTGQPTDAVLVQDGTAESGFAWKILLSPKADQAYSFTYWYLTCDPWTTGDVTASTIPTWPQTFNEGWKELALAKCRARFEKGLSWQQASAAFKDWLQRTLAENNETIADPSNYIEDGYGDIGRATSAYGGWDY